jgi:hypothetical protein
VDHPKGELRSSSKPSRLGHLADELAFNRLFWVEKNLAGAKPGELDQRTKAGSH